MSVKPIRPAEVVKLKAEIMPDGVIEAFNELIAKNWDGRSATVKQDEALAAVLKKMRAVEPGLKREDVFKRHWLDVEDIFRASGWRVEFDKPGYCENYDAFFVFRPGK